MKSTIILCSGGARSGKSEFAERLAKSLPGQKAYIATGQAFDDEMKDRIVKHQARRGTEWHTYEVPTFLSLAWPTIELDNDIILIDCLTMFTTNHFFAYGDIDNQESANEVEQAIITEVQALLTLIQASQDKSIIFVTNELGLGIVPDNKLTRYFRDIAGRINQEVARAADKLYLTISGVTIELKSQEVHIDG